MIRYRKLLFIVGLIVLCGFLFGCAGTLTQTANLYKSSVAEEKADEAYQNKDFATAFEEYKIAAQAGSPYGQFMLANMYLAGEGVQKDTKQYWYWMRQSAENGSPAAHYLIGIAYLFDDPTMGVRHLEKAAALEHGAAMHMLGMVYAFGIGVPQNSAEALKWFRLAQAQGIQIDKQLLSESGIQAYVQTVRRATPPARSVSRSQGNQLVREIQQRLADLGYDPGPVDGMFGGKTKSAIQAFQLKKGLQTDGQATPQLLQALKNSTQ